MTQPEFSRHLDLAQVLEGQPVQTLIEATEAERSALKERLKLLSVNSLSADLTASTWRGRGVAVLGHLSAIVTQTCVITLEPFHEEIEGTVEAHFLPPHLLEGEDQEEMTFEAEDEVIEPLPAASIDLGELVTQHLSLALDPHPKKPGVEFAAESPGDDIKEQNPFAVLKGLVDPDS